MVWPWRKSGACNWTAVVLSSSLICHSTSAFTAALIFIGRREPGLLSMLFVSLCFCRNLCIPIWLAIKPSSRNMRQIVGGLQPICAKWKIRCLCTRCTSLAACVKGRNNKSSPKLPIYTARLIVYADCAIICFLYTQSFLLRSARRQLNKQTKLIVCLNNSTFPYNRKWNKTIKLYCHIPYMRWTKRDENDRFLKWVCLVFIKCYSVQLNKHYYKM